MMAGQLAAEQGVTVLEPAWEGSGPRFVHITARFHNRCGGCGGDAPVGTQITYDRLERAAYHPACAWVAIEQTPWLIPMPAGDEPAPGQVIAHPAYGWLACVRVAGRVWADNGVAAGGLIAVAARRALPEEVDRAQWHAYASRDGRGARVARSRVRGPARRHRRRVHRLADHARRARTRVLRGAASGRAFRVRPGRVTPGGRAVDGRRSWGARAVPARIPLVPLLLGPVPAG